MEANVGEVEARSHWTEQTMHERLKIQVGACRVFTHGISYPRFRILLLVSGLSDRVTRDR